ncbi:thioredoxin domain-containing protein [Marinihelvus fidelis]|uniref:thioredoxin domain-containing protein n=1 Tax=Marinihelvus fidelis TaxID=2613842 RepID=UPI0017861FFB|nr:thioredoxin domain-containing protein [Marinihelvus fidelis]
MNRLRDSASLYLRQHADNPVAWWPWCDEAIAAARESSRPILLSVGYSACHWCHVMAHESFEDPDTAAVMNELFVNIKVDREERPDLDRLYQLSHQMLTGQGGGWPLTLFLAADSLAPFFAGTYFPPEPRHGMPPFTEVLRRARAWHDSKPDDVASIGQRLDAGLQAMQTQREPEDGVDDAALITAAAGHVTQRANREHGGFGGAPKFPQAPQLAMLPRLARLAGRPELAEFQHFTLDTMARGGLRDPLDGGFYRYCVDHDWTIPHFEKMLYDNAQLLPLYADAARRGDDDWLKTCAEGIVSWLRDDMSDDTGSFAASIDADADGEEGGFHTWTPAAARAELDDAQWRVAETVFGLDGPANFEGRAWHLTRRGGPEGDGPELDAAIKRLRRARARRVAPATDHKRLASWNALAAAGLARAAVSLGRTDWLDRADRAFAFIQEQMWDGETLHAVHANGAAYNAGTLDDYAFTLDAGLALLEGRWSDERLVFCQWLADTLLLRFFDNDGGGFWLTDERVDVPMQRLKVTQDDATPSAAAIATRALQLLGWLTAVPRYLAAADLALRAARPDILKYALGHASFVTALADAMAPPAIVSVTDDGTAAAAAMVVTARRHDAVHCFTRPGPGPSRASVCIGNHCLPPVSTAAELEEQLQNRD